MKSIYGPAQGRRGLRGWAPTSWFSGFQFSFSRFSFLRFAFLCGVLAGCSAEVEAPEAEGAPAYLIEFTLQEELVFVEQSVWQAAPLTCEDLQLRGGALQLGWAEGAPDLRVLLDGAGNALCVDTIESVELTLEKVFADPSPDPMLPQNSTPGQNMYRSPSSR
ncbi:MAG: hypothetical protein AAGF12_29770 [Myxococcota bacterium]